MWLNQIQFTELLSVPRQERQIVVLETDSEIAVRILAIRVQQLGDVKDPRHYTKPAGRNYSRVALAEPDVVAQLRRICTFAAHDEDSGETVYHAEGGVSVSVKLRVKLSDETYAGTEIAHGKPVFRVKEGTEEFILLPFEKSKPDPTPQLWINPLKTFSMREALRLKSGDSVGVETAWENCKDQFLYNLSKGHAIGPSEYAAHAIYKPYGGGVLLEGELIDRGWKAFLKETEGKYNDQFTPVPKDIGYVRDGAIGYLARQRVRKLEQEILDELRLNAVKMEVPGHPGTYEYAFIRVSGGLLDFEHFLPATMPPKNELKKLPFVLHLRTAEGWPLILNILEGNYFSKTRDLISNKSLEELRKLQREENPKTADTAVMAEATGIKPKKSPAQTKALAEVLDHISQTGMNWTGLKHVKVDVGGVRGQALHTFARFHGEKPVAKMYLIENVGYGAVYTFQEFGDAFGVFEGTVKRTEAQTRSGVRVFPHIGDFKSQILIFLHAYGVKIESEAKKVAKRTK